MRHLQYRNYDRGYRRCRHVVLTDRAYASIISEVLKNGRNETGGVLVGNIANGIWYVIDSLDPGLETTNRQTYFQWDADYVNHLVETICLIYRYPVTILGFWHRHPGSMDFFSYTDEDTIRSNLRESKFGLLSMLVNIDPELRMSFYYCWEETLHRVRYDVGDEYFPVELLEYATPSRIAENIGTPEAKRVKILPNKVYSANQFPKTLSRKKATEAVNHHFPQNASVQCGTVSDSADQTWRTGTSDIGMENLRATLLQQQEFIGELLRQKAEWQKEKTDWENEKQMLQRKIESLNKTIQSLGKKQESDRMPWKDAEEQEAVTATAGEREWAITYAESEGIIENVSTENVDVDDISTEYVDGQSEELSEMMKDMSGETVSTQEKETEEKAAEAIQAVDSFHMEESDESEGIIENDSTENISVDDISTEYVDGQPEQLSEMMKDMSKETVSTQEEGTEEKAAEAVQVVDSFHMEESAESEGIIENDSTENISVDDISTEYVDGKPERLSEKVNDTSEETVSTQEEIEEKAAEALHAGDPSHMEDIPDEAGEKEAETEQEGTNEDGTEQASSEGDS